VEEKTRVSKLEPVKVVAVVAAEAVAVVALMGAVADVAFLSRKMLLSILLQVVVHLLPMMQSYPHHLLRGLKQRR
jgi:hypothetical protein